MRYLVDAIVKAAVNARAEYETALAKERAMLENASVEKSPLPPSYWQPRHKAQQKMEAAELLLTVFSDVERENNLQ